MTAETLHHPDPAIAGALMRLGEEFNGRVTFADLRAVVLRCRSDLAGSVPGSLPELVERLARQRLLG